MSPSITTVQGWSVATSGFDDDEPRIRDLELAERLGYERPRKIRDLIRRLVNDGKLNGVEVRPTVGQTPGRPTEEHWLTEAQALKVVAKSDTEKADALLDEVIKVFVLARRGLLPNQIPIALTADQSAAIAIRQKAVVEMALMARDLLGDYAATRTVQTAIERVGGMELAKPEDPTLDVETFLQSKNLDKDVIRRKRGVFGKKLKALYTEQRGHAPASSTKFINGGDRSSMIYHESDLHLFEEVFGGMFGAEVSHG